MDEKKRLVERKGKLGQDDDRERDVDYWNSVSLEAKFDAVWELVVQAYEIKGLNQDELRFQRSIEKLSKFPG